MGFFDTIYIVTTEKLNEELLQREWFWDRTEADQIYENQSATENRIVTLYSFDLRHTIEAKVAELMSNRHSRTTVSPLEELRSNRTATEDEGEDVTWTELEFRPDPIRPLLSTAASGTLQRYSGKVSMTVHLTSCGSPTVETLHGTPVTSSPRRIHGPLVSTSRMTRTGRDTLLRYLQPTLHSSTVLSSPTL